MKGDGIAVRVATFPSLRGPTRIAGNQVRDVGGRGVGLLAPVANLVVTGNLVERARHGIVMEERVRADAVTCPTTAWSTSARGSSTRPTA